MRINHNIAALNTNRQMGINGNKTYSAMEKLSSGLKINSAADDAAGLSISQKMRGDIVSLSRESSNYQDMINALQTGEGRLGEVSDMIVRMKELKVQSVNGTYDTEDIENLNLELDALGTAVSDISGITLSSSSVIGDIDSAMTTNNTSRASMGAQMNQYEHTMNNLNTTSENLTTSESRIRDVDMAKEMTEYTKNNILLQASQAMLAQANSQPQSVLKLLQ